MLKDIQYLHPIDRSLPLPLPNPMQMKGMHSMKIGKWL